MRTSLPGSVEAVQEALAEHGYLADEGLSTVVFLALCLHRPLLLEGEAVMLVRPAEAAGRGPARTASGSIAAPASRANADFHAASSTLG